MKIINEKVAYIEAKDLEFLGLLPSKIQAELDELYKCGQFIEFKTQESIIYLKNCNTILDYNEVRCLPDFDLDIKLFNLNERLNYMKKQYYNKLINKINDEEKIKLSECIDVLTYRRKTIENYRENKEKYDNDIENLLTVNKKVLIKK